MTIRLALECSDSTMNMAMAAIAVIVSAWSCPYFDIMWNIGKEKIWWKIK